MADDFDPERARIFADCDAHDLTRLLQLIESRGFLLIRKTEYERLRSDNLSAIARAQSILANTDKAAGIYGVHIIGEAQAVIEDLIDEIERRKDADWQRILIILKQALDRV